MSRFADPGLHHDVKGGLSSGHPAAGSDDLDVEVRRRCADCPAAGAQPLACSSRCERLLAARNRGCVPPRNLAVPDQSWQLGRPAGSGDEHRGGPSPASARWCGDLGDVGSGRPARTRRPR